MGEARRGRHRRAITIITASPESPNPSPDPPHSRPRLAAADEAAALFLHWGSRDGRLSTERLNAAMLAPRSRPAAAEHVRKSPFPLGQATAWPGKILYRQCRSGVFAPTEWDPSLALRSSQARDIWNIPLQSPPHPSLQSYSAPLRFAPIRSDPPAVPSRAAACARASVRSACSRARAASARRRARWRPL